MKARRLIYILIGSFLILVNLLFDIAELGKPAETGNGSAYGVGYFIGSHIFFIIGLLAFRLAYRLNKKIKQQDVNRELKRSIDNIGN